jgi:hypothetical protein
MSYPTDMPAFQAALQAWAPPEPFEAAILAALALPPVPQVVAVFDALKPAAETLDAQGLALFVGAAWLMSRHSFSSRNDEALAALTAGVVRLAALS